MIQPLHKARNSLLQCLLHATQGSPSYQSRHRTRPSSKITVNSVVRLLVLYDRVLVPIPPGSHKISNNEDRFVPPGLAYSNTKVKIHVSLSFLKAALAAATKCTIEARPAHLPAQAANKVSVSTNINYLPRLIDPSFDSTFEAESTVTLGVAFRSLRLYLLVGKDTSGTKFQTTAARIFVLVSNETSWGICISWQQGNSVKDGTYPAQFSAAHKNDNFDSEVVGFSTAIMDLKYTLVCDKARHVG